MPVKKRVPKGRGGIIRDAEMRAKVERLLDLMDDRDDANASGLANTHPFYNDGRHDELCALSTELCPPLGIKPWNDEYPMLEAALAAYDQAHGGPAE